MKVVSPGQNDDPQTMTSWDSPQNEACFKHLSVYSCCKLVMFVAFQENSLVLSKTTFITWNFKQQRSIAQVLSGLTKHVPPPEIAGLMKSHWFPLQQGRLLNPLWIWRLRPRLTSHAIHSALSADRTQMEVRRPCFGGLFCLTFKK